MQAAGELAGRYSAERQAWLNAMIRPFIFPPQMPILWTARSYHFKGQFTGNPSATTFYQATRQSDFTMDSAPPEAGANQQWRLTGNDNSSLRFINRNSGKALAVMNASTADGGDITQYTDYAGRHQTWQLYPARSSGARPAGRVRNDDLARGEEGHRRWEDHGTCLQRRHRAARAAERERRPHLDGA